MPPSTASTQRGQQRGAVYSSTAPESNTLLGSKSLDVSFFATCHPGLEQVVARELRDLGYVGVEPSKAGVAFRGSCIANGYAANMWLRSAIRVLVLLAEGDLDADLQDGKRGGQALYDLVYDIAPWHELIPPGRTFSVEPRLWSCTDLTSTRLVWSRVKDAVCDSIRQHRPGKPQPPERGEMADVPLYVSCYRDTVRIFRDMSGESLHRRGYRDVMHRAALNEAAAAGVLVLSGWPEAVKAAGDGEGLVLADPMCGSGTLLIEAALMARGIAPGLMRSLDLRSETAAAAASRRGSHDGATGSGGGGAGSSKRLNAPVAIRAWPFQRWGDYDTLAWHDVVEEARERVMPPWKGRLLGVDVHQGALSLAERQVRKAGVFGMVELTHGDCGSVVPAAVPQLVVSNPPWGCRLDGGDADAEPSDDRVGGTTPAFGDETFSARSRRGRDGDGGGGGGMADGSRSGGSLVGRAEAGEPDEAYLAAAWRSLDGFLYRQCPGASATIVSGNSAAFRYLKLKPTTKHRLVLSGVDVQVASYKIRDAASRTPNTAVSPARGADPGHVATADASTAQPADKPPHQQHDTGIESRAAVESSTGAAESADTRSAGDRRLPAGVAKARTALAGGLGLDPSSPRNGVTASRRAAAAAVAPSPVAGDANAYDDYWVSD